MTHRAQLTSLALTAALAVVLAASTASAQSPAAAPAAPTSGTGREASLVEYRQHLVDLGAVVEACAKARDTKACDPALVGQDDHVPLGNAPNAEKRLVSYAWVRALLSMAQLKDESPEKPQEKPQNAAQDNRQGKTEKTSQDDSEEASSKEDDQDASQDKNLDASQEKAQDQTQKKPQGEPAAAPAAKERDLSEEPTRPPKPTTSQLLEAAEARLTQDIAQADAAAASVPAPAVDHSHERDAMKRVLAGADFRNLEAPTARDSALEKLGQWLNRLLASAGKLRVHAAWAGRLIVWSFILAVCVGLVWGLMQLERRWRIRLVPDTDAPAAGAASARDWQLWLKDAHNCAAGGQWREAVHFVYWAAISRLESKRLWPADRARTPREYLALVAAEDPRRAGLATLTGSFERTWYGGRAADESEYLKAEELATGLISSSASASRSTEGGA